MLMKFHHILLAVFVAALWGFNFIAVKTGLSEMPPFLYCSARFVIACLPLLFLIKKPAVSWAIIIGIGLSQGIAKFGFMFLGLHLGMSAGLASLVLQSQAFFTIVLSLLILSDKIRTNQIVGMLISFVGIAVIGTNLHESGTFIGFLLIVAAAISWAYCNILFKLAGKVNMFSLVVWSSLIPPIPMLLLSVIFEGPQAIPQTLSQMTFLGWSCLAFTACGSTWLGSTLWGVLLRNYDVSLVAPYSLLIPIFGISFGHILLAEQYTPITYGACGLVFLGLVVNQWRTNLQKPAFTEVANTAKSIEKAA
jgi:O-acetylserine/cysteine efflux transporter